MKSTSVYIIAHTDGGKFVSPVKVGISQSPEHRLRELQTGNPIQLGIYLSFETDCRDTAYALERAFHEVMDGHRMAGEWFAITPEHAFFAMDCNVKAAMTAALR